MALLHATMVALVLVAGHAIELPHLLSDEFIDLINSHQSTWTAGRNFPLNTPMMHIKALMGALPDKNHKMNIVTHHADVISNLPENFDPRDKWPNCPTLNEIRDQGSCGSCWAFGAVEAMTDRVCIYSNGTKNFHFSAEDLLSCCSECGGGCNGGYPRRAWIYWQNTGIVSGGNYNSSQGCKPYEIPPCEHGMSGNRKKCTNSVPTPKCEQKCEASYDIEYQKDRIHAKTVYGVGSDEDQIKAELFQYGPVEASFTVYADFLQYKTGVYRHLKGHELGGHAVKMLGWGVENGTKYWLLANSWNSDWGENNGFFKIVRGEDNCGIESEIIGGTPLLVE